MGQTGGGEFGGTPSNTYGNSTGLCENEKNDVLEETSQPIHLRENTMAEKGNLVTVTNNFEMSQPA